MHAVPATPEGAAERWQRRHCVAVRQAVRKTAVYQARHFLFGKSPVARHHSRAGVSVGARQRVLRYAAPRARHEQSHTGGLEELLPRHLWRALSREPHRRWWARHRSRDRREPVLPPQIQCRPSRTRTVGFRRDRGGYTRQEGVFGGRPAP